MSKETGRFARIVILTPVRVPLTYRVPEPLYEQIAVGMRVLIPLGKRKVTGVVLELMQESPRTETREILATLDERPILDRKLLELGQWIAQYYLATLGEVFGTLLPPSLRREIQRTIVLKPGKFSVCDPLEQRVLERLQQSQGRISVKSLARELTGGISMALSNASNP
jgi:primosomal protein N' (replication factor Y)